MDRRSETDASFDGGFEINTFRSCMSGFYEAVMVNGESCFFSNIRMQNLPERHLHNSEDEAIACAQQRLSLGLTMPGPARAR